MSALSTLKGYGMDEVYEFLKEKAPTYFLATIDAEGNPRVRPFGTIDIFEGKLYIQTGKSKDVYKQIIAHPRVEISACAGREWVRISADLVADERPEASKHMLDNYPHLRGVYDEHDGNCVVLYLEHATTTFTTMGGGAPHTVTW